MLDVSLCLSVSVARNIAEDLDVSFYVSLSLCLAISVSLAHEIAEELDVSLYVCMSLSLGLSCTRYCCEVLLYVSLSVSLARDRAYELND